MGRYTVEVLEDKGDKRLSETGLIGREFRVQIVPPPPATKLLAALAVGSIYYTSIERPVRVQSVTQNRGDVTVEAIAHGKESSQADMHLGSFVSKLELVLNTSPDIILPAGIALMDGDLGYYREMSEAEGTE